MKFLTTNFVQCTVPTCARSSHAFPLIYEKCELVQKPVDFNPDFIKSILVKIDWDALVKVAKELGNNALPPSKPSVEDTDDGANEQLLQDLHTLLLETTIQDGTMTCRNCDHIYFIKSGIPNFLVPPHLS